MQKQRLTNIREQTSALIDKARKPTASIRWHPLTSAGEPLTSRLHEYFGGSNIIKSDKMYLQCSNAA